MDEADGIEDESVESLRIKRLFGFLLCPHHMQIQESVDAFGDHFYPIAHRGVSTFKTSHPTDTKKHTAHMQIHLLYLLPCRQRVICNTPLPQSRYSCRGMSFCVLQTQEKKKKKSRTKRRKLPFIDEGRDGV